MGSYTFELEIHEGFGGSLKKADDGDVVYPENMDKVCLDVQG